MRKKNVIVVSICLAMFFACKQKNVEPVATLIGTNIIDTLEYNGQQYSANDNNEFFVDVTMNISHPRFKNLNEDFGIGPFANIVRKSTYIAIQRNNKTVFVVGGFSDWTNSEKMLNIYDRMVLVKMKKLFTLAGARYLFAVPEEYRNDKIILKIFDKDGFGRIQTIYSDIPTYSYEEPEDILFEYEIN